MRNAILALLFLLGPLAVWSQQPAPQSQTQIRGLVLDADTKQPIAGAEVSLLKRQTGPVLINGGWDRNSSRKATSDVTGAFNFALDEAGAYRFEATATGYGLPGGGLANNAEVTLAAEGPSATEVTLFLSGVGTLTGSVVDADTGDPIPNLQLRAVRKQLIGSRPVFLNGVDAKTDAKGEFEAGNLAPGEYLVEISPQVTREKRVRTEFTEKDLKAADLDYEHTYWPGGHGLDSALPVVVNSGMTANVGTLQARQIPYYRVHVRVHAADCQPDEMMAVSETTPRANSVGFLSLARTPCGKDILVTGFPRGAFRIALGTIGRTRETRGTASIPFVITDESIAITAPLVQGIMVSGVMIPAEGSQPPDYSKLTLSLRPIDATGYIDDDRPVPGKDGKFAFTYVQLVAHVIEVNGLGQTHYVKEIRYNGIAIPDGALPLDRPVAGSSLTIVVDDKVASITGSVAGKDGQVSGAMVVAAKWPMGNLRSAVTPPRTTKSDAAGRFQFTGLAPGEYRVIALRAADPRQLSNAQIEEYISAATKVELSAGASQAVMLEIRD